MIARRARNSGFSVIELLASTTAVLVMAFLLARDTVDTGGRRNRVQCIQNLKSLVLAARVFATDNNDLFPGALYAPRSTNGTAEALGYYELMKQYIPSAATLYCPTDRQRGAAASMFDLTPTNLSYFASLSATPENPRMFLFGDRNLQTNARVLVSTTLVLLTNTPLSWSSDLHHNKGNIAFPDARVQQFSPERLQNPVRLTSNHLLIP